MEGSPSGSRVPRGDAGFLIARAGKASGAEGKHARCAIKGNSGGSRELTADPGQAATGTSCWRRGLFVEKKAILG